MRATILGLALLSTMFLGCGSDGDGAAGSVAAKDCVVIPVSYTTSGCANDPVDLAQACGAQGLTVTEDMVVYLKGERIDRSDWAKTSETTFTLETCDFDLKRTVSVSYGCSADNLKMPRIAACTGYVNADLEK